MPNPTLETPLSLLYQAYASPLGVAVTTDNVELAISRLAQAKTKSGDADLQVVSICRSPFAPDEEIWLIKNSEQPEHKNKRTLLPDLGLEHE